MCKVTAKCIFIGATLSFSFSARGENFESKPSEAETGNQGGKSPPMSSPPLYDFLLIKLHGRLNLTGYDRANDNYFSLKITLFQLWYSTLR